MTPSTIVPEHCPQCGAPLTAGGQRLTCVYCGTSLVRQESAEAGAAGGLGVHLKTITYMDQQGIGMEAFRMLIPATWEFEGGVHWLLNNPGMPAVIACRAYNPQGQEAFEVFPNISCYWTNNPMVRMTFPVGSLYFGNEVRPPVGALQALQQMVIPRFRGQAPGLQIVTQEHLPDLPKIVRAGSPAAPSAPPPTEADGGRIRIRYAGASQEVEEDIYGVVEVNRMAMPAMLGTMDMIFWMVEYLFSFRAAAGQLDHLSDTFMGILRSFRLNPQWFGRYMQVSQYLIQNQIQQINHVGQISRIISQTNNQISDMIMDTYNQRQATMDRISNQFSQSIRGVNEYSDPFSGHNVELPGGYSHAWSNPLGEYIVSNDPNFNPNIGSNATWEPMQQK